MKELWALPAKLTGHKCDMQDEDTDKDEDSSTIGGVEGLEGVAVGGGEVDDHGETELRVKIEDCLEGITPNT